MSRYNHIPVFQDSYRLALDIHTMTKQFPREYKYGLGQKTKDLASELLLRVVAANMRREKRADIEEAILLLEQIRIHIRLASDIKVAGIGRFELVNRSIEKIAAQLSGWLAWAAKSASAEQSKSA